MFNTSKQYELSYRRARRKPKHGPAIVFTVDDRHWSELLDRLSMLRQRDANEIDEYCLGEQSLFALPEPDLFKSTTFGYDNCGTFSSAGLYMHLHIWLGSGVRLHHCAATIHTLLAALNVPFTTQHPNQGKQQAELRTRIAHDACGYGHAVSGSVHESVIDWLRDFAAPTIREDGRIPYQNMHPTVTAAMQEAWYWVCEPKRRRWASEVYGSIKKNGHFLLNCSGNACDLSVYPDTEHDDTTKSVDLECHNLDQAEQQLTLLAGFAMICELARQ